MLRRKNTYNSEGAMKCLGRVLKLQLQWPESITNKMITSEELAEKPWQTNSEVLGLAKQQEGHCGWRRENTAKRG